MQPTAARTERELQILEAMVDRAHELAMGFSEAAMTEADVDQRLKLFDAFQRGFLAVRLGVRLCEALRRRLAAGRVEADYARVVAADRARTAAHEAAARQTPAQADAERERSESDREPVSLPRFLDSLGLAAAAAEARKDQLPADIAETTLPRLQSLLAQAKTDLAPARPAAPRKAEPVQTAATLVLERPTAPGVAKARLLGGAALPRPPLRRRDSG